MDCKEGPWGLTGPPPSSPFPPLPPHLSCGLDFWCLFGRPRNDGQNWIRKPNSLRARERPGPAQKERMGRLSIGVLWRQSFQNFRYFLKNEMPILILIAIKFEIYNFVRVVFFENNLKKNKTKHENKKNKRQQHCEKSKGKKRKTRKKHK